MPWLSYALLAVAVLWIIWKLYIAYDSAGGTIMVVVYDAAVYPPILITIALYFLLPRYNAELPLWGYLLVWIVTTAVVAGAIRLSEELGDRPL